MKRADRPHFFPKRCAVTGRFNGEMVDTGVDINGPRAQRVYLSQPAVEKIGKLFGMVTKEEHEAALKKASGTKKPAKATRKSAKSA